MLEGKDEPQAIKNRLHSILVERKGKFDEIAREDMDVLLSYWNRELKLKQMKDRFDRGAQLWLLKKGGKLAGFRWVLRGRTMEPYFFPLTRDDAHVFDAEVFPQFRGKGIDSRLNNYLISKLKEEGVRRVLSEIYSWNTAGLSSIAKTDFNRIAVGRRIRILNRTIVIWSRVSAGLEAKLKSIGV